MRVFYTNPTKEQREHSFFEGFLLLEKSISVQNWKKLHHPDYIISVGNKTIGIEVTSLVDQKKAEIFQAQLKVFEKAKDIAIRIGLPIIEVRAKFKSDSNFININDAANDLIRIISEKLPLIDDSKLFPFHNPTSEYFSTIFLQLGTLKGGKWLDRHRFHHLSINWTKVNPIDELQKVIDKKEKKMPRYLENCDECWLLIGLDEWKASEAYFLPESSIDQIDCRSFKRVYLLRNIQGKVLRIK